MCCFGQRAAGRASPGGRLPRQARRTGYLCHAACSGHHAQGVHQFGRVVLLQHDAQIRGNVLVGFKVLSQIEVVLLADEPYRMSGKRGKNDAADAAAMAQAVTRPNMRFVPVERADLLNRPLRTRMVGGVGGDG